MNRKRVKILIIRVYKVPLKYKIKHWKNQYLKGLQLLNKFNKIKWKRKNYLRTKTSLIKLDQRKI